MARYRRRHWRCSRRAGVGPEDRRLGVGRLRCLWWRRRRPAGAPFLAGARRRRCWRRRRGLFWILHLPFVLRSDGARFRREGGPGIQARALEKASSASLSCRRTKAAAERAVLCQRRSALSLCTVYVRATFVISSALSHQLIISAQVQATGSCAGPAAREPSYRRGTRPQKTNGIHKTTARTYHVPYGYLAPIERQSFGYAVPAAA